MLRLPVGMALSISLIALLHPTVAAAPAGEKNTKCVESEGKKAKRSMFGGILSNVAGTVFSQVGGTAGTIANLALPAASLLSDELLKLLDCKEQTNQAVGLLASNMPGGVGVAGTVMGMIQQVQNEKENREAAVDQRAFTEMGSAGNLANLERVGMLHELWVAKNCEGAN